MTIRLLRIALNVTDLRRACAFYSDALGFAELASENDTQAWVPEGVTMRSARLRLGDQEVELTELDPPGDPYPPDSTAADLWFQHCAIVTRDIDAAYAKLRRLGATPITHGGPQRLPPAAGSVIAYKFRDPDGHPLELIQFPPGRGDPAWQRPSSFPTLGIDHSALCVAAVDRSVAFYAALGLACASRQVNAGSEQDRLDGLAGVAVDVVALLPGPAPTPHVELLGYRTPRGRPRNPGAGATAIADSRLIFVVEDLADRIASLEGAGVSLAERRGSRPGHAFLRDPDGHALVLLERP